MPAPLHLLGVEALTVRLRPHLGLRRDVHEPGRPAARCSRAALQAQPDHELASSPLPMKERAFALRGLAQKGDPLATGIFDFQAKAMGLFVAMLAMALDPEFVVIGGGLMDPDATTDAFRARYLQVLRDAAAPYLWTAQKQRLTVVQAALGDLSQAIGAALVALYSRRAGLRRAARRRGPPLVAGRGLEHHADVDPAAHRLALLLRRREAPLTDRGGGGGAERRRRWSGSSPPTTRRPGRSATPAPARSPRPASCR